MWLCVYSSVLEGEYCNHLERLCCNLYRFADKPKKGVRFLQEKGLVGSEPKDVAKFFFTDERLDKVCFFSLYTLFSSFSRCLFVRQCFAMMVKIASCFFAGCCGGLSG